MSCALDRSVAERLRERLALLGQDALNGVVEADPVGVAAVR
jgi:hypothetical protein